MVAGIGEGELSLNGSVFCSCIPTTIVGVHVRLMVGVLHGIHVTLVSLGWGAVHAVHRSFVAMLKNDSYGLSIIINDCTHGTFIT